MKQTKAKSKSRKLKLSRESLRELTLTREQLGGVAGGYPTGSVSSGTTIYSRSYSF